MRTQVLAPIAIALSLCGCGGPVKSQSPSTQWTNGFWFWEGSSADSVLSSQKLDVLYVQGGTIFQEKNQYFNGRLPDDLPEAREYWMVFRFERQGVPGQQAAPILVQEVKRLREMARQRHLNVVGVQLDIDSPTGALARYASFLREVRKGLPPGVEVSITALLDWFRDGTAIADVIKETDEFVPQFYDIAKPGDREGGSTIATKFDAVQWAPKFNRFRKRFRIGISTFGRARYLTKDDLRQRYFGGFADIKPLDVAINPAFVLTTSRSPANELVLNYQATRKISIGYNTIEPGETVQFILQTPELVRAAVDSVKQMRGYCAGVVFFRWPASNEDLTMQPEEVLNAASLAPQRQKPASIRVVEGGCVAVNCEDVYLEMANPLSSQATRYRMHSSTELEYFLPDERLPVRMLGPSELELSLPAYCARGRLYLGRAVAANRAEFTVREEP